MIKDLTNILRKGILLSDGYDLKIIKRKIESISGMVCRFDLYSRHNWYFIDDCESIANYGCLSARFPVALLSEDCPDYFRRFLEENGILTGEFPEERCSCDWDILKQYAPQPELRIIDDMGLCDGRISFDSVEFDIIASGSYYLTPYNFNFYAII